MHCLLHIQPLVGVSLMGLANAVMCQHHERYWDSTDISSAYLHHFHQCPSHVLLWTLNPQVFDFSAFPTLWLQSSQFPIPTDILWAPLSLESCMFYVVLIGNSQPYFLPYSAMPSLLSQMWYLGDQPSFSNHYTHFSLHTCLIISSINFR